MKFIFALIALSISTTALADTYVRGHTTKSGTYVEPHYRSDSNSTKLDNYSSKGNSNPYTGKQGTVDPYKSEPYNQPSSNQYKNPYDNN